MTNHSKEVGTFSRVSGLHGAWICDWTSHVFADLGTVAKKHQMYWAVLFIFAINKNTSITVTPEWTNNIMTHTSTLGKYQQNQLSCTSPPAMQSALPGATYFPGSWSNPTWWLNPEDNRYNWKWSYPILSFFIATTQVLCTETVQVRAGQSRTRDLTLLVATMSTTQPTRPEWVWVSITTVLLLWDPGRNTFRRDWLIMWFKPGGVIAIGFQHGYLLQMIGSDCSGWNFSSWFYKKNYSLNRRGDFSFGVGRCLPGRQGKDVILCSPAAFLFHDPEDHVHRRILHLPCDTDASLSGPGFL